MLERACEIAPDLAHQLLAISQAQYGIFTAGQAYDAGFTHREIQRLRAVGSLVSLRRGVYAVARTWRELAPRDRQIGELVALQLVLEEDAVISHQSAGIIHGLSLLEPDLDKLHVTRPGRGGTRMQAGVHHHAADLPPRDVVALERWRLTSLARTAIDIARASNFAQGVAALDSVLSRGASARQVSDVLLACGKWRGARMACRAFAVADGRSANAGESWSRAVLIRYDLAPTDIQRALYDEDGLIGIVDFIWDPERVVGEFDGRLKYKVADGVSAVRAGEIVWAEKRREDRIRALGFQVVRWGYADLYRPGSLAARVRKALDGRS